MSVFGPNQVEELIIGTALASEVTMSTFVSGASDTELAVVTKDNSALAEGKKFFVVQKTTGSSAKHLNYEFSDEIDPAEVESIETFAYVGELVKIQNVTGFGTIATNSVYTVMIRIMNDGGTLSPENFRHVAATYTTGSTAPSTVTVINALTAQLNASVLLEGSGLFAVTKSATKITVTGKLQDVVPGKITGRPVEFEVEARVTKIGEVSNNLGLLTVATTQEAKPGTGTGKYAVNLEWFTKGYKYEHYREASWPSNFDTPYYAEVGAGYSVIHIKYKKQRKYTNVENQYRVLTILTKNAGKNLAGAATSNAVLAKLATVTGLTLAALPTS